VLVAEDDPELSRFFELEKAGLIDLRVMPGVGCEAVAQTVGKWAADYVAKTTNNRAFVVSCTVAEHGANSATFHALASST
jgi:6-pyruvoyltetrahydropterin/6-carboxytetrahydropterin synthase